jgi:hypothetical protein
VRVRVRVRVRCVCVCNGQKWTKQTLRKVFSCLRVPCPTASAKRGKEKKNPPKRALPVHDTHLNPPSVPATDSLGGSKLTCFCAQMLFFIFFYCLGQAMCPLFHFAMSQGSSPLPPPKAASLPACLPEGSSRRTGGSHHTFFHAEGP